MLRLTASGAAVMAEIDAAVEAFDAPVMDHLADRAGDIFCTIETAREE